MGINLSNFLSSKSKNAKMIDFQDLEHIDGVSISVLSAFTSSGLDPVIVDTTNPIEADMVPMSIITTSLFVSNTGYLIKINMIDITNRNINNDPM
mgnify:CR=1 FL=1